MVKFLSPLSLCFLLLFTATEGHSASWVDQYAQCYQAINPHGLISQLWVHRSEAVQDTIIIPGAYQKKTGLWAIRGGKGYFFGIEPKVIMKKGIQKTYGVRLNLEKGSLFISAEAAPKKGYSLDIHVHDKPFPNHIYTKIKPTPLIIEELRFDLRDSLNGIIKGFQQLEAQPGDGYELNDADRPFEKHPDEINQREYIDISSSEKSPSKSYNLAKDFNQKQLEALKVCEKSFENMKEEENYLLPLIRQKINELSLPLPSPHRQFDGSFPTRRSI